MTVEFINNQHILYPKVKVLGKQCAATLGFMPEGGFDDYARAKCIITASEGGELMGYLMFRQTSRFSRIAIVHLAVDNRLKKYIRYAMRRFQVFQRFKEFKGIRDKR